jgi:hypothetical protein
VTRERSSLVKITPAREDAHRISPFLPRADAFEVPELDALFICPDHALVFSSAGWDRARIQAALYRAALLPLATITLNRKRKAIATAHPELGWLLEHPELPVPVVEDPGCFDIAVVGGAAGRGTYFYGAGEPVTLAVDE